MYKINSTQNKSMKYAISIKTKASESGCHSVFTNDALLHNESRMSLRVNNNRWVFGLYLYDCARSNCL